MSIFFELISAMTPFMTSLSFSVNDSKSIESELRGVGFEVKRIENSSLREMSDETREFGEKLRQADVALYYYSGHGVQHNNTNWLLPVDSDIRREQDLEFEAYNLTRQLGEMEGGTKNRVNIVINDLDMPLIGYACEGFDQI